MTISRADFLQRYYLYATEQPHWPAAQLTPSAVLVGLQEQADGLHLVLTRRAAHLRHHAHQLCFPGGRAEPLDTCLAHTALREAQEEIGLAPHQVELIGRLPTQPVLTRYLIHPYLAFIPPQVDFRSDPNEVAEVLQIPLQLVLDQRQHYVKKSKRLLYNELYFIPVQGQLIWGATAAIIRRLADQLEPAGRGLYRPVPLTL